MSRSKRISSRCRPWSSPAATPPPHGSCEITEALASLAAEIAGFGEVHDVRVRETADGEIVNFHCRIDAALSVSAVHDLVDTVERALRRRFPSIARVIGHAEPRR